MYTRSFPRARKEHYCFFIYIFVKFIGVERRKEEGVKEGEE